MFDFFKRFLTHRYLPLILVVGAVLVMLPALQTGLFMDDLPQRAVELKPSQLPARLGDLGLPPDCGSFGTVINHLFGAAGVAQWKSYGVLPWWAPDDIRPGFWRPFTAFTHWLDYQLFPDTPALMHVHNIVWFAAIVFLVTFIHRNLMGPGWAAGLAGLLFLLDGNTYFPVMCVANRGFMLSLFFGLISLYQHHQWRSAKSRAGCGLSLLFLALALLANEGGVSTLAFLLAYALVLEPGSIRDRVPTVLPSILTIVLWRTIYQFSGVGVFQVGLYVDPVHEPLEFARVVISRVTALLGGQLTGIPPDVLFAVKPALCPLVIALFGVVVLAVVAVVLPWLRRDKMATFWFAVMLLAAIPAATVEPMSKNLAFVAVGAYGLIASFLSGLLAQPSRLPGQPAYRTPAWIAGVMLILVHVPGVVFGRILPVKTTPVFLETSRRFINLNDTRLTENNDVIVINAPCASALIYTPYYKAYCQQPLPRTLRSLVPGCTSFDVRRTDDRTLVIQSRSQNIFACDDAGPIHPAYFASAFNGMFGGAPKCKKGDQYDLGNLMVEILETDVAGVPSRVAFRFGTSLDSPDYCWLWFKWETGSFEPLEIPANGQSITIPGPRPLQSGGELMPTATGGESESS